MSHPTIAIRLRIKGRVQGVAYRAWAARQASMLSLSGWIRNRSDGSVEAVFSGPEDAVGAVIDRCRQGPAGAVVRSITEQIETDPVEPGFRQAPTV